MQVLWWNPLNLFHDKGTVNFFLRYNFISPRCEFIVYLIQSSCPVTTNVGLLEKSIQLASCGAKELLPMSPMLPADLFSSCLTTPIKTALLWYCYHRIGRISLVPGITPDMIDK